MADSNEKVNSNENKTDKKKMATRVIALLGVILLVGMILATFVVACIKFEGSDRIFKGLLSCDIAIPILLWFYLYLYNRASKTDKELEEKYQKQEENNKQNL